MILIIQNGYVYPNIVKYLDDEYTIIKSFEQNVSEINIDEYKLVIILGGYQSITRIFEHPQLLNVVNLIKKCAEKNKPLLGICLGCQMIGYAMGCEIKSSGKLNVGYDATLLGFTNVFRSHIDYVVPCSHIEILETFENMPYLIKYKKNIIGVQCHPDITPEYANKYSGDTKSSQYAEKNQNIINEQNKKIIDILLSMLGYQFNR